MQNACRTSQQVTRDVSGTAASHTWDFIRERPTWSNQRTRVRTTHVAGMTISHHSINNTLTPLLATMPQAARGRINCATQTVPTWPANMSQFDDATFQTVQSAVLIRWRFPTECKYYGDTWCLPIFWPFFVCVHKTEYVYYVIIIYNLYIMTGKHFAVWRRCISNCPAVCFGDNDFLTECKYYGDTWCLPTFWPFFYKHA